jgi:cell fate regulator YaaT (PSP1 superfamily)
MPIHPLPQFEADLEEDRKIYERLKPPTSIVVRFGVMSMIGEFPYSGDAKPGCGSKFVVRTHRGTELAEMLTSTCPNAGCSKSVTRKQMLEYIENSGGRDYPFFNQGRVLRLATAEDLARQRAIDESRVQMARSANLLARTLNLPMKVVDAEPLLGGERITFYFTSEERVDFRELVAQLAAEHRTRIEMRQVGARDEARLVADYEKCGQHCCCKQFLKVLKPISMKSAKIQKATLDPLKISGRCGRLMCCLRYEDQTYDELRARLPKKKTRVKTPDGWATVLDSQILTQLVLVRLDSSGEDVAVPVENLIKDGETPPPPPPPPGFGPAPGTRGPMGARPGEPRRAGPDRPPMRGGPPQASRPEREAPGEPAMRGQTGAGAAEQPIGAEGPPERRRRRRRRGRDRDARPDAAGTGPAEPRGSEPDLVDGPDGEGEGGSFEGASDAGPDERVAPGDEQGGDGGEGAGDRPRRRRRRRRRRGGSGGGGGGDGGAGGGGGGGS